MAGPNIPPPPAGFTVDTPQPIVPDTPTPPEGYIPDPNHPGALTPWKGGPKDPNAPGTSLTPGALDDATSRLILTGQMDPMGMSGGPVRVQILNNRDVMLKRYGITDQQLPAIRSMFDADSKAYSQRTQQASFQKQALDAAQQHYSQIATDLDNLPAQSSGFMSTPLNWASNEVQRASSGRTITDLDATIPLFKAEVAKIMTANPSGAGNLTDQAQREFDVLNSSRDPQARKEAMQKIIQMAQAKIAGDDQETSRLGKKIGGGLASYANFGLPGDGSPPGPAAPPTGPQGPQGPTGLDDNQKQAYNAFLAANPTPTGKQVGDFLTKLTGRTVTNGDDIAKAIAQGRGASTSLNNSTLSDVLDATKNDVAGIAQGVAALPDLAAKGVGKVMSVVPNAVGYGLDALGYTNAAKDAYGIASNLAHPFQIGDAIEGIAPTPNNTTAKAARTVGQLVGGVVGFPGSAAENVAARIVGDAPKPPLSVADKVATAVQDGKNANVPVLTSDVRPPTTFVGKAAQAIGERIPITGTGGTRAAQQAARIDAVKSAAQDFGAASGDVLNSPAIDDVAADLAQQRGAQITRLTNAKNAVISGTRGVVPVDNAVAATDQEIAKLQSTGLNAYAPVVAKLNDWKQALQGKDLQTVEMLRKQIGQDFTSPDLASVRDVADKALSNIYGPLREDMGNFIKANGNPGDFDKWQSANQTLAGMVGDLKNTALKRSLATADTTPENVASLLFSSKPSDVRTLYAGLSATGRAKAQAAIIQRAVEKAGGMDDLSPDKFANQISGMGKQIGVFFQGDDAARLNGLSRVLSLTQRAAQAAVAPPTGVQAVPYALGAGFSEALGIPKGVAAALGTGLLARAYESVPVRNLLLKLGESTPGTQSERYLMGKVTNAINAAVQKPTAVSTALNDNVPKLGAAVASPNSGPNQQQ